MKTEDLISLMGQDARVSMRQGRMVTIALACGVAISALVLLVSVGIRRDMGDVIGTSRVLFKIMLTLVLAVSASGIVYSIGRPATPLKARVLSLIVPLLLLATAVVAELLATPPDSWEARLIGQHASFCLVFIPTLSLAPLTAFVLALRRGAPESPGLAGAAAGLAAGGIAAAIYAWHCPDDSPLFVVTWYVIAIGLVTLAGYLLGRRLLRW